MPRTPDPLLHERIMNSARQLFAKGGAEGLSMRALAKLSRTTTTAVYRRFKNRDAILRALIDYYRKDFFSVLQPCRSIEELFQAMLDQALKKPSEYQFFYSKLMAKAPTPRPSFEFVKKRCAEWLGGHPDDYTRLVLALFAQTHGTAMLFISKAVSAENEANLMSTFKTTIKMLIESASA
jgi:AcrR family transcriptional regulator